MSVVCGQIVTERIGGIDVLIDPVLVVEVLSPGTEHLDKEQKRIAYQKLASVKEYLIVALDAPHVTQYRRQGRRRARSDFGDLRAAVELNSIPTGLPLSEIYQGVAFD